MHPTLKIRLILCIAFLFALFSLLAALLLNIGGVSTSQATYPPPAHTEYNLISWSFTTMEGPQLRKQSYVYNLYLNRVCPTVMYYYNQSSVRPAGETTQCRNNGVLGTVNLSDYYANVYLESIDLFGGISTINLGAPFAFLVITVLAAICQAMAAVITIIGPCSISTRNNPLFGLTTAGITFGSLFLASAILTGQMEHLKRQLGPVLITLEGSDAHLGNTALGLAWGAAAVSFMGLAGWWEVRRIGKEDVRRLVPRKVRSDTSV